MAFQVIVDGNLDNADMDYTGKYAAATCYNSEKATDLAGMMRNERDWVVVFNIPRIEAAIKAGKFINVDGVKVPVVDGRKSEDGKDSEFTRYIPVPKTPRLQHLAGWQVLHRQRQAVADLHHHRHRKTRRPVQRQDQRPARCGGR